MNMSTMNFSDNLKNNFKTMDEIEMAFLHIINDFRQMFSVEIKF